MRSAWPWILGGLAGWACDAPRPVDARTPALTADDAQVAAGVALSETLRCGRCHVGAPAAPRAARLAEAGSRLSPAYLAASLASHAPEIPMDAEEAGDVVQFLSGLTGPTGPLVVAPLEVDVDQLERGRQLYHRVGCVACHAPYEDAGNLEQPLWEFEDVLGAEVEASHQASWTPPFGDLWRKTNPEALARYLEDPLAIHPGGAMPSLRLSRAEAEAIAEYLFFELAVDDGFVLEQGTGLVFEAYEGDFVDVNTGFAEPEPVRRGAVADLSALPEHREDSFGFVFRGFVAVPLDVTAESANLGAHTPSRSRASSRPKPR